MKADWEVKKLGELCEIKCGATPLKSDKSFWENGTIPWFTVDDIRSQGRIIKYTLKSVTEKALKKLTLFPKNTVLLCCTASVGEYAITDIELTCNQQFNGLIIKNQNYLYPYYLFYFVSTLKSKLLSVSGKTTIDFVSNSKVCEIEIPVPPLAEQKRIVEILDQKFVQIDQLKQNAEKNLQNAKELFQAELTKAFSNNTWEKKRLGDVCGITSKLVDPTQSEYLDLYHVGGANIVSETGKIIDLKTSKEESLSSSKFTFDNSMVLYNKIRPYLKKVARPNFSGLCSADMYPLSPKSSIEKDFLYYVLISKSFTDYAISKSDRAGMPKVNRDALFSFSFPLPPLSEQQKIVAHLDALQEKVRQLEEIYTKQIANCDELKQSFLKKAFEGEL